MKTVLTLCEACRAVYSEAFTLKTISGETTTEKKKQVRSVGASSAVLMT